MMKSSIPILMSVILLIDTGSARSGPVSPLYLTAGDERHIHVVQGRHVLRTWTMQPDDRQFPIAVTGTVRTLGAANDETGAEYTLTGTPTGPTYSFQFPTGGDFFLDGATDGVLHNYAWDFTTNTAYQWNLDWSNPVKLFSLPVVVGANSNYLGITYDPSNDSLWICSYYGTVVENRAKDGTLLSSFTVAHGGNAALALDPADNTLWLHDDTTSSPMVFEQYSKSGTLLSTQTYPSIAGDRILGGEFGATAVPKRCCEEELVLNCQIHCTRICFLCCVRISPGCSKERGNRREAWTQPFQARRRFSLRSR